MGGAPTIEWIRDGVGFTPEAAAAFRRAEAHVRAEFGRDIDVNSTYRDWDKQLAMYNAWQAYITGRGPYPGHSKALHPSDPLAFHTKGLALDSDDWRNARIVQILAEHGFIRNRIYVKNEQHHFEYLRDHDKHINDPDPREGFLMALTDQQQQQMYDVLVGRQQLALADVFADRLLDRNITRSGRFDGRDTTLRAVLAWADENIEATRDIVRMIRADLNYIHQVSPYSLKAILEASKKGIVSLTDEQADAIAGQLSAVAVESLAAALEDDFEAVRARLAQLPEETIAALKKAL